MRCLQSMINSNFEDRLFLEHNMKIITVERKFVI